MKKLFAFIAVIGMLNIGASFNVVAQDETAEATVDTTQVDTTATEEVAQETATPPAFEDEAIESTSFHQVVKKQFIQGGAMFMSFVLLTLILDNK